MKLKEVLNKNNFKLYIINNYLDVIDQFLLKNHEKNHIIRNVFLSVFQASFSLKLKRNSDKNLLLRDSLLKLIK